MTARRAYGSGSIKQLRDGVWLLRWRTGIDPFTGLRVQRQETFTGGAKAAQIRLAHLIATTSSQPGTVATLGDLLTMHHDHADIAPSTRLRYDYALRHLPAGLRERQVDTITAPMIAELYRRLTADGVPVQTIRKLGVALSSAYRHGIEWGVVDRNPCRGVRPPAIERRTYVIPTPAQLQAMLADADTRPGAWGVWLRLALATGARRGEVLALRWQDIDGARVTVVAPKTQNSIRQVTLDADTQAALRAWWAKAAERALSVGTPLSASCFIVSDDPASRTPWRSEMATKRLARLSAAHGCPGARLHDLRHAHATMLLEAGVSVRTVADRLGHTRVSTTMDIYGHALPAADQAAADLFGQLMAPG